MRIDLALKYLCLAKSRSAVKALCDDNAVLINGHSAKASASLAEEDRVTISGRATFLILKIPHKQLSKVAARDYYRVVHE
jgi:ribosomal 50S subunit-recycling heat shock protein